MDDIKRPKSRTKLTPQEEETISRLNSAGRTSLEIAATLGRTATTINSYLERVGLRQRSQKPAQPPKQRYEVTIQNIPPAVFRLTTDAAVRRGITIGEAMLRCTEYVLKKDAPAKALDVIEFRHSIK
jgi:DNA-binding CsgD family transcriptional regulator